MQQYYRYKNIVKFTKGNGNVGKLLLLALNEQKEKIINKITSAIADYIRLEPIQATPVSFLSFPKLEIRQHQRLIPRSGEREPLKRYGTLLVRGRTPTGD